MITQCKNGFGKLDMRSCIINIALHHPDAVRVYVREGLPTSLIHGTQPLLGNGASQTHDDAQ